MRNLDNKEDALKESWLQAYEIQYAIKDDLTIDEMTKEEAKAELELICKRAEAIMQVLHDHIPEDMSDEEAEDPVFILQQFQEEEV